MELKRNKGEGSLRTNPAKTTFWSYYRKAKQNNVDGIYEILKTNIMAKVIIFPRVFHKHAQRAGNPTYFVEKILNGQGIDYRTQEYLHTLTVLNKRVLDLGYMDIDDLVDFQNSLNPEITESKTTTIRQSVRIKPGESFSPRIWRGKPYTLNDIVFCDNITTKSITPITLSKTHTAPETLKHLYKTEGFDTEEAMKDWFLWDSKKYKMFEGFKIRF